VGPLGDEVGRGLAHLPEVREAQVTPEQEQAIRARHPAACAYRFDNGMPCGVPAGHSVHRGEWRGIEGNHAYVPGTDGSDAAMLLAALDEARAVAGGLAMTDPLDAQRLASCKEAATRYRDERDAARADADRLRSAIYAFLDNDVRAAKKWRHVLHLAAHDAQGRVGPDAHELASRALLHDYADWLLADPEPSP